MNNSTKVVRDATISPYDSRLVALLFALGVLGIAMLPGFLIFWLDPNAAQRIGIELVPIPVWVFPLVWNVAYPMMGIATWLVWRKRHDTNVSIPLVIFAVGLIQTLSFWLTNSLRMTAVIDATGVLLAYTVAFAYYQYDKRTVWWLLPWLLWMPVTFGVKLWVVLNGVQ